MPDADDFDVEYFRNLLKGDNPKETHARPAAPPPSAAKKNARRTDIAPGTKGKSVPTVGRKKPAPGTKRSGRDRTAGR